jgi:gas vesicle protein
MQKNVGTNVLMLVAGLLAGAAIGILYAPDEGSNTRDKLSFRLSRYREKLASLIGQIKEVQEAAASEAKSESDKVIAETKMEAERLLGHVEALMDQIKEQKGGA